MGGSKARKMSEAAMVMRVITNYLCQTPLDINRQQVNGKRAGPGGADQ